jgi:hypothetical protein
MSLSRASLALGTTFVALTLLLPWIQGNGDGDPYLDFGIYVSTAAQALLAAIALAVLLSSRRSS